MKVVVLAAPLKLTVAPLMKLEPLTVRVKAPEPAAAVEGASEEMTGAGIAGSVMVKMSGFEVPPPGEGLVTVTAGVPAVAI